MLNDSGASMAAFAESEGINGPTSVPAAMSPAAWQANVRGNARRTPRAIRASKPLFLMPSPRPNAATRSHHTEPEKAPKTTSTGTPAAKTSRTAMQSAVASSGRTPKTHHAMAPASTPSAHTA